MIPDELFHFTVAHDGNNTVLSLYVQVLSDAEPVLTPFEVSIMSPGPKEAREDAALEVGRKYLARMLLEAVVYK